MVVEISYNRTSYVIISEGGFINGTLNNIVPIQFLIEYSNGYTNNLMGQYLKICEGLFPENGRLHRDFGCIFSI